MRIPKRIDVMGQWIRGTVMAVTKDEILFKHSGGKVERIKKKKITEVQELLAKDNIVGKKVLAYITLPGMSSRHMGMDYGGFCLER